MHGYYRKVRHRGGNIPLIMQTVAYGFDSYNQEIFEEVSQTIKTDGGGDSIAKVMVVRSEDGIQPNKPKCNIQEE